MCGAGPCSWQSIEPALQLRGSTNARLELCLTKMADGAPRERPPSTPFLKELTLAHQGAACQRSHLSSIIDDLTASTSQLLKYIKQKSAVRHDPLAAHIAK